MQLKIVICVNLLFVAVLLAPKPLCSHVGSRHNVKSVICSNIYSISVVVDEILGILELIFTGAS